MLMNKYVIYSVVVGGYDEVRQPAVVDDRFDYVLFSDEHDGESIGVWRVRAIPHESADILRLSRYAKCMPAKVLPEYEASLYVDANVRILTPWVYDRFVELMGESMEWAGVRHPDQHCIYDEICAIVQLRWVLDSEVAGWYGKIKNDGFPEKYGLYENNVIFRRHTKNVEKVGELWWRTLKADCKRDQFSLMYALWKVLPTIDFFLLNGECPRTGSEHFAYYEHNPHKRVRKLGFHEMLRYRIIRTKYQDNIRKGYKEMFDWVSRFRYPKAALALWEIISVVRYAPKMISISLKRILL